MAALECPICTLVYSSDPTAKLIPKMFPCGHSFCLGCSEKHLESTKKAKVDFTCPTCRQPASTDSAASLPNNFALIDALRPCAAAPSTPAPAEDVDPEPPSSEVCNECDIAPATCYCIQCSSSLCDGCKASTHASKIQRTHEITSVNMRPVKCSTHKSQQCLLYCSTDDALLCAMCVVAGQHKDHAIEPVEIAARHVREELRSAEAELETWQAQLRSGAQRLRIVETALQEETVRCLTAIATQCDGLVRLVRERQQQLERMAQTALEDKTEAVRAQATLVEHAAALVDESLGRVRLTLGPGGDAAVLQANVGVQAALEAARRAPLATTVTAELWMRLDEGDVQAALDRFGLVGDIVAALQEAQPGDVTASSIVARWAAVPDAAMYEVEVQGLGAADEGACGAGTMGADAGASVSVSGDADASAGASGGGAAASAEGASAATATAGVAAVGAGQGMVRTDKTHVALVGLQPEREYRVRVRCIDAQGRPRGAWSGTRTFTTLPATVAWDASVTYPNVAYSTDHRTVTRAGGTLDWTTNVVSAAPCDQVSFTFRVTPATSSEFSFFPLFAKNSLLLGFISPATMRPGAQVFGQSGAYTLYCASGTLYGTGLSNRPYTNALVSTGSTVRCVRDRAAGTISFTVNGMPYGPAWHDVPADLPLHAFACLTDSKVTIDIGE